MREGDEAARAAFRGVVEDALRPLAEPQAILSAACGVLSRALGADRVFYAEFDDEGQFADVIAEAAPERSTGAGRWSTQRFPTLMAALRGGQRIVLSDLTAARAVMLPNAECAALRALGAAALVSQPLCKDGHCVAVLCAQRKHAHAWHDDELWRIGATAERTWASVVQARSELALQRTQERFRCLISVLSEVPWTSDARGAFVSNQLAWQAYTGQDWAAHVGFGWLQAVHPADREALQAARRAAGQHGERFEAELRLWHAASAGWRTCRARAAPLKADDGRVREWVGSCDDVDDARRAAAALREADRRQDVFLATLAHELRNPLAPVRIAARLMSMPGVDARQVARARAVIDRQTRHMALLLDDLLDAARITQGRLMLRKQRIELAPVVDAAVEAATPAIDERRHALHLQLPDSPVWLDADPLRLTQVLVNLLTNAARYTPPGGRIGVVAATLDGRLELAVSDNGNGLSAGALESIFSMFAQGDSAAAPHNGGLGIGLALVKGLLTLHDGSVRASSAGLGQGSRFVVSLPLAAASG